MTPFWMMALLNSYESLKFSYKDQVQTRSVIPVVED